jgi:RNA polymerase sigma-70 factor (ECF subfamily)
MMALALRISPGRPTDDEELIDRVRAGDEAAFSELYRRHARAVAGVVYRLLGSDQNLEDIVQETFVIGLRSLERLRDASALRCWLKTIAVRRVQKQLASRYRARQLEDELSLMMPQVNEPCAREDVHALYQALADLPDKLRIPWMLHHIEGETLETVASMCDTSLTSTKRHIAAAGERLRRLGHAD